MDFLSDLYHAYRHVRFVRMYERDKDTRWSQGVYLRTGGELRDIRSVEGMTWTLDGGERVDTRDIYKMVCARIEIGYV